MGIEIKDQPQFPEEVTIEKAQHFFDQALEVLQQNEGLHKALAQRFIQNPQMSGFERPGRIKFESNKQEYILNLERGEIQDRISINTVRVGVEEELVVWINYKVERESPCAFEEGERGEAEKASIRFDTFFNGSDEKPISYKNNSQAAEKIREFLRKI